MSFEGEIQAFQEDVKRGREREQAMIPVRAKEVEEWTRKYALAVKGSDPAALPPILDELWVVFSVRNVAAFCAMVMNLPPANDGQLKYTLTCIALVNMSELLLRLIAERDLLFVDYDAMVAGLSASDTSIASLHWHIYRSLCEEATGKRARVLGDLGDAFKILPVLDIREEEDVPELEAPDRKRSADEALESDRPAKKPKTRVVNIRVQANDEQLEALLSTLDGKFY
jgi:hypothetical protein